MVEVIVSFRAVSDSPADRALLDAGEQERADRRARPAAFVTAHALQRAVLGSVLGRDPRSLTFRRSCHSCGSERHGKPAVVGHPDAHFSLSYDDTLAVVAVSRGVELGVDIEHPESTEFDGFPKVTLHPDEVAAFQGLRRESLLSARARVWARKEAVLKATGHGLVVDPTGIVVSSPLAAPALRGWYAAQAAPIRLRLVDLAVPHSRHECALAVLTGEEVTVRMVQ